jgi:hypothetical protein
MTAALPVAAQRALPVSQVAAAGCADCASSRGTDSGGAGVRANDARKRAAARERRVRFETLREQETRCIPRPATSRGSSACVHVAGQPACTSGYAGVALLSFLSKRSKDSRRLNSIQERDRCSSIGDFGKSNQSAV